MARGMNKVTIIGFVEREPEMRYAAEGDPVTSFAVSTSRHWITSNGEARESTEWFNIVAWRELAEAAKQLLRENQRVYAEGHLQTRSWDDEDGLRHFRTEVVASKLIPLDGRGAVAAVNPHDTSEGLPLCLNRVLVIGNLGRDPEMRYTPSGQAVTSFSLAATCTRMAGHGDRRDSTEWFNVVTWGSLAEICNQYLSKGRRVYLEGELRTRGWEQADGKKHFRTELVANEMIILGPRPSLGGAEYTGNANEGEFPF